MRPIVNYSLHNADKADIPAEIHKYCFYKLCDQYADYCRIYTDGSKASERVASAIVVLTLLLICIFFYLVAIISITYTVIGTEWPYMC